MKKKTVALFFLLLAHGLAARTLVLPLTVDTQNHASYQWLGKAVSFYLAAGLEQNALPVCGEEEVQALLNRNLVRFPYAITKATAMILAAEGRADQLLWGKILYSDKKSSQMLVQLVLIDLKAPAQKHLPLVKRNFSDMFKLQEELLRNVVRAVVADPREIILPRLNLSLPEYEKLVKSLLLGEAGKKLELLLPKPEKASRSDFVNFELAKVFLEKGDPAACRAHLDLVNGSSYFKDRKDFLLALADHRDGNDDAALERFIRLQQQNVHPVQTHNNLGAIYLGKGNFPLAEKCLGYALYLRNEPAIQANLILLLQAMGRPASALQELTQALRRFPEDERLLELFAAFIAAAENREALSQAFRDFVRLSLPGESVPAVEPLLLNPYGKAAAAAEAAGGNLPYIEARNLFLENDFDGAMQKAEEAMESNPFEPENHHLLALLSLQKKQFAQADLYAQSTLFLSETLDNYLLQLKVQQAGSDRERFRATLARALKKFPQNPELLQLGGLNR